MLSLGSSISTVFGEWGRAMRGVLLAEAIAVLVPDFQTLSLIVMTLLSLCRCAVALGFPLSQDMNADFLISLVFGYAIAVAFNLANAVTRPQMEDAVKKDARAWHCSLVVAMKLHHVEKHINEMVHAGVMLRLADLEERERWRSAKEWFALRDEWGRRVNDPATPPELRAYYTRCLEEFPQTPVFGPRYLA